MIETEQRLPFYEDLARKNPTDFLAQGNLIKITWRYETLTSQWYLAFGFVIASAIFYVSLYLFFERDRDIDKKKKQARVEEFAARDDRDMGISMCVMNDAPGKDLEEQVLKKNKKKDMNSALYKEEFAKENTSNVRIYEDFYRDIFQENDSS